LNEKFGVRIEDDVLVGGNCGIYEGTQVRQGAVLGAGVVLYQDREINLRLERERDVHPVGRESVSGQLEAAAADGLLRVVDESGEDYLYPAELFLQIELPQAIEKALLPAA